MVTATKPNAAARLITLYRREQEHWGPHEMIETFYESCPNTQVPATFWTRASHCRADEVTKTAETAIRKMVDRGHGAEIETFLKHQAERRAAADAEQARARLRAALDQLALQPNAEAALELIADVMDALTSEVPLDASSRAALVDQLRAAMPTRKSARRAVAGLEAALARKGAA